MKRQGNLTRVVAIYLIVVFAMCAIAVFGVSAKTYTWTHTVELAASPGDSTTIGTSMGATGRMSATFPSYPTIYGNYSSSTNKAKAYNYDRGINYGWKNFTLYENGGVVMVTYGTSLLSGGYDVQYVNVSNGGFKSNAILSRTY